MVDFLASIGIGAYKKHMHDDKGLNMSQDKIDKRAAALRENLKKRKKREKPLKSDAKPHKSENT